MSPTLAQILIAFRASPSRTGSLIVTIYGDAIAPRGGSVWLGTLLAICEGLGIGPGVVRTAVSRLASEGWLSRCRVGRSSYYRLAEPGRAAFAAATRRIYGPPPHGPENLQLAFAEHADDRARLEAAGWGTLAPGVMAGADGWDPAGCPSVLAISDKATLTGLAVKAWKLDHVAARYRHLTEVFAELPENAPQFAPFDALLARILLVHEYRRAVLRDPLLPAGLLPENWPGTAARSLIATAYPALLSASEAWLDVHAVSQRGRLPPPGPEVGGRFNDSDQWSDRRD